VASYELAIIGTGNIGRAIAAGLADNKVYEPQQIVLTRRRTKGLDDFKRAGFAVSDDNISAVKNSSIILIAVEPQQVNGVLEQIAPVLKSSRHLLISVVSGISIGQILGKTKNDIQVVRPMPNTAIAIGESMTCLASNGDEAALEKSVKIFESVGETLIIPEEHMIPATALSACGIAFFLRAIRAASQGGIEIGFSSENALKIAAQTARGAASLILASGNHPEREIDKVTTPRGCTIAGLNQMEHEGFSSAMIKGIVTSSNKASKLYDTD